jgi:SAM-dependent methyltransferase
MDSPGPCLVCRTPLARYGEARDHVYGLCPSCGTVQLAPMPSQETLADAYQAANYATDEHGQGNADSIRKSSRNYYESLAGLLVCHSVTGPVVDYGCGWGGLTELLAQRGHDCLGLEACAPMVAECRRRGLRVEDARNHPILQSRATVQAFVMCGVFEHLAEPREFLTAIHRALRPGGMLITLQPTAPFARLVAGMLRLGNRRAPLPRHFDVFDAPWHTALYSLRAMEKLAGEHGFRLVETRLAPQGRVGGAKGLLQAAAHNLNRLGWPVFGRCWPLAVAHIFVFTKR